VLPFNKLKGIEGRPVVVVDGKEYSVKVQDKELVAELPYDVVASSDVLDYVIRIKSNGMDRIRFYPRGGIYKVNMKSNYSSPGFKGYFLPVDRTVSDSGFEAQWIVTDLNTFDSVSQFFDVEFVIPAGLYQQSERAIKYSFLIILLVFVSVFLVESITGCRVNIVQYIVTGLSLCLFYLLLLSISEYLSFGWSYVIASTMTIIALGAYFYGFLKSKVAISFTGAVACLYGFIYILLQMETGALLAGTIALFVILCVIMYYTRRNDLFDLPRNPVIE
jgi:inner membrane protein